MAILDGITKLYVYVSTHILNTFLTMYVYDGEHILNAYLTMAVLITTFITIKFGDAMTMTNGTMNYLAVEGRMTATHIGNPVMSNPIYNITPRARTRGQLRAKSCCADFAAEGTGIIIGLVMTDDARRRAAAGSVSMIGSITSINIAFSIDLDIKCEEMTMASSESGTGRGRMSNIIIIVNVSGITDVTSNFIDIALDFSKGINHVGDARILLTRMSGVEARTRNRGLSKRRCRGAARN